jgi:hypothetical protein
MHRFPIVSFAHWIAQLHESEKFRDNWTSVRDKHRGSWLAFYKLIHDEIEKLGFNASLSTINRITDLFNSQKVKTRDLAALSDELRKRLDDELSFAVVLSLTAQEGEIYLNPRKGWEDIVTRFPETLSDIEEAQKCFALARYPASVFHSCQIIEIGLIEFGSFIGVSDPKSGWTAVASALDKIVNKKTHQQRSVFEKNFVFLEQLQGTVESIKNAWRNTINHAQGRLCLMNKDFSAEIAEEILIATRAFMRRLAEGIPRTTN